VLIAAFRRRQLLLSLFGLAVEWLFTWPDSGMPLVSCSLFKVLGLFCAGAFALPLSDVFVDGDEGGKLASDEGTLLWGKATEPEVCGAGGASAFLQPDKVAANSAQAKMERDKSMAISLRKVDARA
jgi:hypothetical protein